VNSIRVRNPATGEVGFQFRPESVAEVQAVAERLRRGQPHWAATPPLQRLAVLEVFAAEIAKRGEEILAALQRGTGRLALSRIEIAGIGGKISRDGPLVARGLQQAAIVWIAVASGQKPLQ
jgi:acyl-CoA reductase-like NAD-dependent aldehyde dehydrogenase